MLQFEFPSNFLGNLFDVVFIDKYKALPHCLDLDLNDQKTRLYTDRNIFEDSC